MSNQYRTFSTLILDPDINEEDLRHIEKSNPYLHKFHSWFVHILFKLDTKKE